MGLLLVGRQQDHFEPHLGQILVSQLVLGCGWVFQGAVTLTGTCIFILGY